MLSGQDRAIVTDIRGTTRDILTETIQLGNMTLLLSDTAGIRESSDPVEKIGVDRALKEASAADLLLCVIDSSEELDEKLHGLLVCPEVLLGEDSICLDYSNKSQVLEVESLACHLGSHKDVCLAGGKVGEHFFRLLLAFCNVRVVAGYGCVREQLLEFFLYLFRSGAPEFQSLLLAGRAYGVVWSLVLAPVAP